MGKYDEKKPATMFVQPMLEYKSDEWLGMVYGWPHQINSDSSFLIGFAFKTKKYAEEFFNVLKAYNNGEPVDSENNIRISLVTEDLKDYSVYVYPSYERKNVLKFQKDSEEKYGKDNKTLILNLTMCKPFPYGEGSNFKRFKEIYLPGNPIELKAFLLKDGKELEMITDIESIIKRDIKIKHRKLINKDDDPIEYSHGKNIMGK